MKISIDGKELTFHEGETILECALRHGIDIPHLCYDPRLTPSGACRLCLVEIEGQNGFHTACTRVVAEGMVVRANTEAIRALRKDTLELLLSEHNARCATCDSDGDCQLQDYVYEYGAQHDRYPSIMLSPEEPNYSTGNKAIAYDPSKCVRCLRCVKICDEVQGCHALTMRGRAGEVAVTTGFDVPLYDSTCEACGQCISACPVSALYEREAIGKGRSKDFAKTRTTCPYCGVGCQIDLNVHRDTGKIVRATSEAGIIPNDGNLCIKGRFGMDFVNSPERLTAPLIKENGAFREASWEEALDLVASRLTAIKNEHGADALGFLSSAKTTNEENYVMQKLARAVFGTNNVDHCARLCHASTVAGLAQAFGSGAMTNSIAELRHAPLVFVIGSNTTECHPIIGILIRQAVEAGETKLVVADPRRISLTDLADIHIRQRPGTDVALINAFIHVIIKEGLEDRAFIEERTENYEAMAEAVATCTPEWAEPITEVPAEDIRRAARLYATAPRASIVYSMGITQHTTGTDNVLSVANLAMITGNVGREFSGVNPLRGQNNVQGACDMGALPNVYPGYQKVGDPAVQEKFEKAWNAKLSDKVGLTIMEIMDKAAAKELRGLYIMGENGMVSEPDINHVRTAMETVDFLVVQDIFLTETAELADVVLPAASFAEKSGTFTNTERRVQPVRPAVEKPGQSWDDWQIISEVATRAGYKMHYDCPDEITNEIASVTPSYGGITPDRLESPGLQWPCPTADHPGTKFLHAEKFARGKGKFHAVKFLNPKELPDEEFPFILTTGRMLEHFHTGSMTRRSAVLDDRVPHGSIELNPVDAEKLGVNNGDQVRVASRRGEIELPAQVTDRIPPGTLFHTFHFAEHPVNALTNAERDPVAKIPEYKVAAARVEKAT